MPGSNKINSRSNLYRSRRKLRKSLAKEYKKYDNENSLPSDWMKPIVKKPDVSISEKDKI